MNSFITQLIKLANFLFVLGCIFIPLGVWKAIEIGIWLYKRIITG